MKNETTMKILIIAPFTPPYTGNALPVKLIYDHFHGNNIVTVVNLSKSSLNSGIISLKRILEILNIFLKLLYKVWDKDLIYLTVSESLGGNIRDIIIYILAFYKRNKIVIHMLGGNSMQKILSPEGGVQYYLNRFFIKKFGGVMVEGKFQEEIFSNVISRDRIIINPNYAQHNLFSYEALINQKFDSYEVIKILFLSNLIFGKGHYELVHAFAQIDESIKNRFQIDIAGGFDSEMEKEKYLEMIKPFPQICYHGHVGGILKEKLFKSAHVFCLPTYYPFEGQPFVIVEAYAAGCAVITTNHSGIGYIFNDCYNGIEVKKMSIESLKLALLSLTERKSELLKYALNNFRLAKSNYTEQRYIKNVEKLFSKIYQQ